MSAPATSDRFEQLTGPFDRPIAPSPVFAQRLRRDLHQHAEVPLTASAASDEPVSQAQAIAMPTPIASRRGLSTTPRARWSGRIAAAILVLLLTGLAISLARLQMPNQTAPPDTLPGDGGGQTTTQIPSADGNWGGGVGHTWAFTMPGFDTRNVTITQGGENSGFASSQSIVSNGSLVVSSRPQPDGSFLLEAFTLTGNPRWQVPIGAMPGMAIDNERLYLIRDDLTADTVSRPLTAISLETGEVLWTGPDLASTGKAPWGWSPIVANGTVYVANQKGGAYALDAKTGEQLWQAPIADESAPLRADGSTETQTGGSIALGDGALWVAGWTNTIRKLDPATGEVLATITLDPGMGELDLALRDSTLIAKAEIRVSDTPQSTLVAIDTDTNGIRWTKQTPSLIDNMVVLQDRVIVNRVDQGEIPTLNVDAYMLATGELRSIPMPMLETSGASLSAIDGANPLLLIVSADSALTVVDAETGTVVATQEAPVNPPDIQFHQFPVIRMGDVLIFAQPNGNWFRITP